MKALVTIIVIVLVAAAGSGIWVALQKKTVSVTQPVVNSGFKPSAPVQANVLEDVVKDDGSGDSENSRPGLLQITYDEMSFNERMTYEVLYGKNVFEMLSRAIPEGIGLKTLDIDNFQTVYAVGLGETRELVSFTFSALKSEKLELLPQPYSYITSNSGKGYRFVVTCKTNFGLDLADPFQAIDHIGSKADLPIFLKKFTKAAQDDQIVLSGQSVLVSSDVSGTFKRYVYRVKGECTYKNFVHFVLSLYQNRLPCALKKVKIVAKTGAEITFDTEILFTLKE